MHSLLQNAGIEADAQGSEIKEINEALKSASKKGTGKAGRPEFVAVVKDFLLVIEDKASTDKHAKTRGDGSVILDDPQAVMDYAVNGALHYARHLAAHTSFTKIIAIAVSGDEKRHKITPFFVSERGFVTELSEVEDFIVFNEANIDEYYTKEILNEPTDTERTTEQILKDAADLHEDLRNYGNLRDTEKPIVVAGILLAIEEIKHKNFSLDNLNADTAATDGEKIYNAISDNLRRANVRPDVKKDKLLAQFAIIKNTPKINEINPTLGKTPLKHYAEFLYKNIYKSIKYTHSSEDILGRFYSEFMSYSGADGQTLGIVLTPRHICELFCDLADLKSDDIVFDPCCGTGGFLIAAMHKMLSNADEQGKRRIKERQLFGIEEKPDMFSLATTNMILRGDGKSNLENKDFLKQRPADLQRDICASVGMMNPPYSQGKIDKNLCEIAFTEHLLNSLMRGARCVVIVPQSALTGKSKEEKAIKQNILKHHTLQGVITLNKNTFYGVGTNPAIAVFTAHEPHPRDKICKFVNFENDGFEVQKHKGLVKTINATDKKAHLLNVWFDRMDAETKFCVKTTIEADDEWLHSFYYFNDEIPTQAEFERVMGDYLTFEFDMIAHGRSYLFETAQTAKNAKAAETGANSNLGDLEWEEFKINDIFCVSGTITTHPSKLEPNGKTPRITCAATNNGLDACYKNEPTESGGVLTLDSATTAYVGYQEYDFIATDHVEKITLKNKEKMNRYVGLFVKQCIDKACIVDDKTEVKKYAYGYKCSQARIKRQIIKLPVNSQGEPDYEFMEKFMRQVEQKQIRIRVDFIKKNLTQTTPCDLSAVEWREFILGEVFEVNSPADRIDKSKLNKTKGAIPYISRTDRQNGIDDLVGVQDYRINAKNAITIGDNTQTAFYQSADFYTAEHIQIIRNDKLNQHNALFILVFVKKMLSKFSWGNAATVARLRRSKILLPVNSQGEPDYEFMENFMRGVEQRQLKKALGYYSTKLAELDKFAKLDGQNGAKS